MKRVSLDVIKAERPHIFLNSRDWFDRFIEPVFMGAIAGLTASVFIAGAINSHQFSSLTVIAILLPLACLGGLIGYLINQNDNHKLWARWSKIKRTPYGKMLIKCNKQYLTLLARDEPEEGQRHQFQVAFNHIWPEMDMLWREAHEKLGLITFESDYTILDEAERMWQRYQSQCVEQGLPTDHKVSSPILG